MVCKLKAGRLMYGVAVGALALTPLVAQAQNTTGTMSSSTTTSTSMAPTQVTGTVLRYYVDRSGYVTAMDVQTANGVQMVRFAPGLGQRLYSTYPVGGQASLFVSGNSVVGMGDTPPAAGFMPSYMVSDIDLLRAEPYIMTGARLAQFNGRLRSVVSDPTGEVLGLVLSDVKLQNAVAGTPGAMNAEGMTGDVLVRVPREFRHAQTMGNVGGSMRVTPLFPGSVVEVVGYPEAPRFGVLSRYGTRVAANALVLNGRAVGAVGIPKMNLSSTSTLINSDLLPSASAEERNAAQMGYTTYDPTGLYGSGAGTGSTSPGASTSGGGTTGSAVTGGTGTGGM
jgi:hypothetical protein